MTKDTLQSVTLHDIDEISETQVRRALDYLNRGWPKDLYIFIGDGTLTLFRGQFTDNLDSFGCADSSKAIDEYPRIEADGGGW